MIYKEDQGPDINVDVSKHHAKKRGVQTEEKRHVAHVHGEDVCYFAQHLVTTANYECNQFKCQMWLTGMPVVAQFLWLGFWLFIQVAVSYLLVAVH